MIYLVIYIICYIIAFCGIIASNLDEKQRILPESKVEAEDVLIAAAFSLSGPLIIAVFIIYMIAHYAAVLINKLLGGKQ